jgi:threonine/homoserine/homoserine lactone efflux protein
MHLYLEGLLFGVVPVFFVGPVLFTLLHASLQRGFGAGALVAFGIAVSDACAVALCALGVGPLLAQRWGAWGLELAGGLILVGFGVAMLRRGPIAVPEAAGAISAAHGLGLFTRGFLVNFVNPFVFTFWIGAIGGVGERHGFEPRALALFFAGVISTILITDLLKAWLAEALRRRLGGRAGIWAPRVSGLALGAFGVYLLAGAAADLPALLAGP